MKRTAKLLALLSLFMALTGCTRKVPTHTVCLVDTSRSIDPAGVEYEFGVLDTLVDRLQRGDTLTILPISGNALNDTSGHVLTFTASPDRQAYDHDLVVMRQSAHERIKVMKSTTASQPAQHTDILGALEAARQVFTESENVHAVHENKTLIVLSDFIEDDGTFNFMSDRRLASLQTARGLAALVQSDRRITFSGLRVQLLTVVSSDRRNMSLQQQHSVAEFWKLYFKSADAEAEIQIAGTSF